MPGRHRIVNMASNKAKGKHWYSRLSSDVSTCAVTGMSHHSHMYRLIFHTHTHSKEDRKKVKINKKVTDLYPAL